MNEMVEIITNFILMLMMMQEIHITRSQRNTCVVQEEMVVMMEEMVVMMEMMMRQETGRSVHREIRVAIGARAGGDEGAFCVTCFFTPTCSTLFCTTLMCVFRAAASTTLNWHCSHNLLSAPHFRRKPGKK